MKWKIRPEEPKSGLPPVGCFWKHKRTPDIYLRIDSETGRQVKQHDLSFAKDKFYSVAEDGRVVHTDISSSDIETLSGHQIDIL